jgi:hypothetical protein
MQANTVRKWKKQGMWHHVRWGRGRKRPGWPPIPATTRDLIRAMRRDNVLWGAPRIHGALAKLGLKVSRTTVATYMTRRRYPPSPPWRTFLRNQAPDLAVAEMSAGLSGHVRPSLEVSRADKDSSKSTASVSSLPLASTP